MRTCRASYRRRLWPILSAVTALCLFFGGCEPLSEGLGPAPQLYLEGHISTDLRLEALDEPYVLRGFVFVDSLCTLTIDPGTRIVGATDRVSALVISRGATIIAEGTRTSPIVFSSGKPTGSRAPGDWGGLIINGRAPINNGDSAGSNEGEGETGLYGGDDENDNSGILRYVRIEFSGYEYNPEKQLNGIAFQGVGRGTQVDHIQVHMGGDDGIEFFGGTVDARYLLCTSNTDDSFDWTDGWRGRGQFWISYQFGPMGGNKAIEANNVGQEGTDDTPVSSPVLYNLSLVCDEELTELIGMNFRKGTRVSLYNSIVQGFGVGVEIDGSSWSQFVLDSSRIRTTLFNNVTTIADLPDTVAGTPFLQDTACLNRAANTYAIQSPATYNFRATHNLLDLGIPAVSPPRDGFFDAVDYIGAMGPEQSDDWTAGWTTTAVN